MHACLVASLGGFREAVDRAARTAVADAVQDDGALDTSPAPLVLLRMLVHGPLVVVPSPSVACAAVLLRLGDVHLHNEFERKACARKHGAPALFERVQARLCASQLLAAGDGNKVLDAQWNLLPGCRPHWALQESELRLTLEHMRRCEEGGGGDGGSGDGGGGEGGGGEGGGGDGGGEGEEGGGATADGTVGSTPERAEVLAETPPEVSVSVRLSPVHLPVAWRACVRVGETARRGGGRHLRPSGQRAQGLLPLRLGQLFHRAHVTPRGPQAAPPGGHRCDARHSEHA